MLSIENLHTVFGNCPERCLVLYPDAPRYTVAYANPSYLQAVRRNAEDVVGKGIFEAFPERAEDLNKASDIRNCLQQVLEQKCAYRSPLFRFDLPEDPESTTYIPHFWIAETYPLVNPLGSVEFIVRKPFDVTQIIGEDLNRGNQPQMLMGETNSPLFQDHPDAVFTLDLEGNFLSVNKNLIRISEYTEAELIGMSFRPFVAEEDLQLVSDNFQIAKTGDIRNFDARVISRSGKRYILNITHLPIIVNNEVVGVCIVAKDVTAIKKAEQQLETNNQRISNILESVTDGFLALDHKFTVTYWNKEAERILGKSRKEVMGKNLWDLYPQAVSLKFYSEYHRALAETISLQFQEYLAEIKCWLEVMVYPSEEGLSIFFKDITDRIEAEKKLQDAKEQYQLLFDLSPLPKWVYDMESLAILDVNKAAINQYGYTREEFLSMTLKDLRPSEDVPLLMRIVQEQILPNVNGMDTAHHINAARHRKKSGQIIDVEVNGATIFFQGRVARLAVVLDVTERQRWERQLQVSEQRFKALVQEGSDLIQIINKDGYYTYVSPNSARILDVYPPLQVGNKAFDSLIPEDRERILPMFFGLQNGECITLPPFRCVDRNNEIQWLECTLTNLMEDPAVEGIVANSKNITERIKSEIKIKESVEQYDIVSQATNDAIYEWSFVRQYLKWNRGFEALFGHDQSTADDKDRWFKMLHPEDKDRVISHLQEAFKTMEPKVAIEYRFKCADGTFKHVLDRGYLIYDEQGNPMRIIGAIQDVTERVEYIRSLEDKNKRLSEISWLQSHVVRAPLTQIMSLSELLTDVELIPERKEMLSCLRNAAAGLDKVVRDIIAKTEGLK
jgi:PAS domain S-box-containing protein